MLHSFILRSFFFKKKKVVLRGFVVFFAMCAALFFCIVVFLYIGVHSFAMCFALCLCEKHGIAAKPFVLCNGFYDFAMSLPCACKGCTLALHLRWCAMRFQMMWHCILQYCCCNGVATAVPGICNVS